MSRLAFLFIILCVSGCTTKINSVRAGFDTVEAKLSNAKSGTQYHLMEVNNGEIASCIAKDDGVLNFEIENATITDTKNSYIYISDGKEPIKFSNDKWNFRNPVWDLYAQKYEPIKILDGQISDVNAALEEKKEALESCKGWLKNSRVFTENECKAPTGDTVAGFAGGVAGGEVGAVMGSVVPGLGTLIGGLVGSYIGEKMASGDVDTEVEHCELILKYGKDSYEQIPTLENTAELYQTELKSKSEQLDSDLEQVKAMTSEINANTAF